jgi:phosphoribosylamine--glycine ligase
VVLPLLESDLLTVMRAVTAGSLKDTKVRFSSRSACCVILASKGYPLAYEKGFEITVPEELWEQVYVAGAKEAEGRLVTSGGRVLGVTAVADTLREAVDQAYRAADRIRFENKYLRRDIGARALRAQG